MAVTPNYGWPVPVATDYVKDGWEAISDLGNAIDTTVAGLGSGLKKITSASVTAGTTININNCFTSTYDNYRIIVVANTGVANSQLILARLRLSGTDSTTSYNGGTLTWDFGGTGATTFFSYSNTSFQLGYVENAGGTGTTAVSSFSFDVINPAIAKGTSINGTTTGFNGGLRAAGGVINSVHAVNTAYDGITIYSANNWSGFVTIYGYQK